MSSKSLRRLGGFVPESLMLEFRLHVNVLHLLVWLSHRLSKPLPMSLLQHEMLQQPRCYHSFDEIITSGQTSKITFPYCTSLRSFSKNAQIFLRCFVPDLYLHQDAASIITTDPRLIAKLESPLQLLLQSLLQLHLWKLYLLTIQTMQHQRLADQKTPLLHPHKLQAS